MTIRTKRPPVPWLHAGHGSKRLACLLLLAIILLSGCAAGSLQDFKTNIEDIKISSHMQKKRHHELIRELQPPLDRGESLSAFRLFLLAAAYYEIRDHEKMFKTVDLLEERIRRGDAGGYGGNLTAYPQILRGYAYLDQGDAGKALAAAKDAMVILEREGKRDNTFYRIHRIDISSIAGVASALAGSPRDADAHLKTIEEITTIDGILGPEKFIALARIHMARKDYRRALAAIQDPRADVLGLYTAFYDQTFQEIPKYFILAKCLYETGREEEAKKGYDQLLGHPQIRQIGGLLWPVLLDRARIARRAGDGPLAEALLKEAVTVVEKQRASIGTETGRIGYVGDKQAIYQELVSLLSAADRAAEAFEYVERAKGRALVDLLASQSRIAPRGEDAPQIDGTLARLALAEKATATVADHAGGGVAAGTRGVVVQLKQELRSRDPDFASLTTATEVAIGTIQARLGADETLLEFYAAGEQWYAFVLRRDGVRVTALDGAGLEKGVLDFRERLTRVGSDAYLDPAKALYRQLIAPVAGQITTPTLIVVPHGVLHYLPFGALFTGKDFLIERYRIRVLPNASILGILKDRGRNGKQAALILGNPDLKDPAYDLKYAEEEVRLLGKIIPQATVLTRGEARASVIRERGDQYRILHFAAHGLFDSENPLDSALLLAGNGLQQGRLRAGDLYRLRLNSDLITLSACETALSTISRGDDVIGFTRGFLYAGARSIVSSLWKVDDRATRDLMVAFYERIPRMEKDKALREAQLRLKKRYPHPFYWAAFQLTGLPE
jgi:CHAT domain-containing protein